jgi:transcriptional antiterminator NusG
VALHWYIVHTYSGFEHKVKSNLEETVKKMGLQDQITEVLVPTESVVELAKGGERRTSTRKFYPGYVLIQMELNDQTWHVVKDTPKVTGFVGGKTNPIPITEDEAAQVKAQMEEGAKKPKPKFHFEEGEEVKVIDGPFQNFQGTVEEVNQDKGKLRVLISIFGRATPVELEFVQVMKV